MRFPADGPITWELLTRLEPRLADLERLIQAVRDPGEPTARSFCANSVWYGGAKPLLLQLAGWHRNQLEPVRDPNRVDEFLALDLGEDDAPQLAPRNDWERKLCTSKAYDVAYQRLYEQLPHCRNCGCL